MRNRGIELFILPEVAAQPASPPGSPTSVLPEAGIPDHPSLIASKLSALHIESLPTAASDEAGPHSGCVVEAVCDVESILVASGVPGWVLPRAMAAAHEAAVSAARTGHQRMPTLREASLWAGLTRELAERGWPLSRALAHAWRQVLLLAQKHAFWSLPCTPG